jgi:multidrug efflux pump
VLTPCMLALKARRDESKAKSLTKLNLHPAK